MLIYPVCSECGKVIRSKNLYQLDDEDPPTTVCKSCRYDALALLESMPIMQEAFENYLWDCQTKTEYLIKEED